MVLNFILTTTLPVALMMINSLISKKSLPEREKPSAFECGFEPKSSARLPFSLRFYLIAVIFLIFDVEITLLMPLPILTGVSSSGPMMTLMMIFIGILLLGLYHEWLQGALNWK
uniref:NADH-ubiquinone oxidoreductase chain 3 n=1 Tax=Proisotoma minuta TaxID=301521 RepID=A0A8K1HHZ8_9HEXA|nr:NADH dehydrogenase subunit 3 [Proisotoma minuta]